MCIDVLTILLIVLRWMKAFGFNYDHKFDYPSLFGKFFMIAYSQRLIISKLMYKWKKNTFWVKFISFPKNVRNFLAHGKKFPGMAS